MGAESLKREIEQTAAALKLSPSTVGERAGQGGMFYHRLCNGARVWPETEDSVRKRLKEMVHFQANSSQPSNGGSL